MTTPLTPAERHILELTNRGYEDAAIAQTFGLRIADMRAMRDAAEKKLENVPAQREEYWDR